MHIGTTDLQLEGKRFGKLVVLERLDERKSGHIMWKCQCDCGTETTVRGGSLTGDNTHSCGCLKTKVRKGNKYGKLTAAERVKTDDGFKWRCECDCGNETLVVAGNLFSGNTKSCGCISPINEDITERERQSKRRFLSKEGEISYPTWRTHVNKKCNSTCVVCGYVHKVDFDIIAHHLDGFDWCEEKRVDVENGATMCKPCHTKFHARYGRNQNTKEQFDEFLESEKNNPEAT